MIGSITGIAAIATLALACRVGDPAPTPAEATPAPSSATPAPAAATAKAPTLPELTAVFTAADGRKSQFRLEVAATPADRERGLMHRKSLPADRGMVFVFPADADQTFWMKNTFVALDMVFVQADGRVAGVVQDARPLTLDPRSVGKPSRYVVELVAGTAAARGIRAGARVVFDPPPPPVAE